MERLPLKSLPEIVKENAWRVMNEESVENQGTTITAIKDEKPIASVIRISYTLDTRKLREGSRKYPYYLQGAKINDTMHKPRKVIEDCWESREIVYRAFSGAGCVVSLLLCAHTVVLDKRLFNIF